MEILNKSHFYHNKFIVFGHRGVPSLCQENTLESFKMAVDLNYDGIELDVVKTNDNILIVHHDAEVLIKNQLRSIKDLQYKEVLEFDSNIPTLEAVLDTFGHRININIEIKSQGPESKEVPTKVIALLKKFNLIDSVVISSFNPQIIKKVKKADDRFVTAWILGKQNLRFYSMWPILFRHLKVSALHINHKCITSNLVARLHLHQIKVLSYTINSNEILKNLINTKIDGFFTDCPEIFETSKRLNL